MKRYWLRSLIRMLNVVEEQLGEFRHHSPDATTVASIRSVYIHLKAAISALNDLFDSMQAVGE